MGQRVETRMIERLADGSWRFATYVWNEAGTDAKLAPAGGNPSAARASADGASMRGGRSSRPGGTSGLTKSLLRQMAATPFPVQLAQQPAPDQRAQVDVVRLPDLGMRGEWVAIGRELCRAPTPRTGAAAPS